jgi:hypothetical protein
MSEYTAGSYSPNGNGGCLMAVGAIVLAVMALVALAGGDSTGNTSTNTASMEALSRNQVNLWSDVTNEYYNCYAAGSCVTSVTTTSTESTSTNVEGESNSVIYSSNGTRLCANPDKPGEWGDVAAWCEAAGVTP